MFHLVFLVWITKAILWDTFWQSFSLYLPLLLSTLFHQVAYNFQMWTQQMYFVYIYRLSAWNSSVGVSGFISVNFSGNSCCLFSVVVAYTVCRLSCKCDFSSLFLFCAAEHFLRSVILIGTWRKLTLFRKKKIYVVWRVNQWGREKERNAECLVSST